jgi:2,3-bisphosphoglycerate-dependent phosphoglycerate mutase
MTYTLILLRHGESEWNQKNLFTGWVDVDLNEKGIGEAKKRRRAAQGRGACCPTSCTPRCCAARSTPRTWRSTRPTGTGSRCSATGASTSATTARCRASTRPRPSRSTARSSSCCGAAATTTPPPRSTEDAEFSQWNDPRYADIPETSAQTECLKPTWSCGCCPTGSPTSSPTSRPARSVLVTAHGNSLRALVKHLDGISDADIAGLNIPTGIPLVYELDDDFKPVTKAALPRPRGRGRGCAGGRQPGPLNGTRPVPGKPGAGLVRFGPNGARAEALGVHPVVTLSPSALGTIVTAAAPRGGRGCSLRTARRRCAIRRSRGRRRGAPPGRRGRRSARSSAPTG